MPVDNSFYVPGHATVGTLPSLPLDLIPEAPLPAERLADGLGMGLFFAASDLSCGLSAASQFTGLATDATQQLWRHFLSCYIDGDPLTVYLGYTWLHCLVIAFCSFVAGPDILHGDGVWHRLQTHVRITASDMLLDIVALYTTGTSDHVRMAHLLLKLLCPV